MKMLSSGRPLLGTIYRRDCIRFASGKREDCLEYAFTVVVNLVIYDVYYFNKDRRPGTLAFCKKNGKYEIGIFRKGQLSQEEVESALNKNRRE